MAVQSYRELLAWQNAMELVVQVYRTSRRFPHEETYGLTAQLRRAAVSVAANIAEGQGRGSGTEFSRFLHIAHGSLREIETHLLIAQRLEYVGAADIESSMELASEVGRLVNGLIKSLS